MDEEVGARAQAKKKKAKKKKKKKKRKKAKKKKARFPGGKRKKGQHKSPLAFLLDEANARGLGQNVVSEYITTSIHPESTVYTPEVNPHSIGVNSLSVGQFAAERGMWSSTDFGFCFRTRSEQDRGFKHVPRNHARLGNPHWPTRVTQARP